MTPQQFERIASALERIATALERAAELDPMAALAEVLQPPSGAPLEPQPDDAPDAEAWRFR